MGMICTPETMVAYRRQLKQADLKVAMTNGCFDTFHAGHLATLRFARKQANILIAAVNTDESIRTLKGPHRPIHKLADRMAIVAELACVDYVVPFGTAEDPSVEPLVKLLEPDVLVKGGQYTRDQVVGGAIVEHRGGRVVIGPVVPGVSTTGTVEAMKRGSVEVFAESRVTGHGSRPPIGLVDLDGVLVDFVGSMARALNLPWKPEECRGEYDPGKIFGVPTDLFSLFGPDFWEACDWMPDGEAIWETVLRLFGDENVYLCSSPTHESSSPMGKLRWIERHLPEKWMRRYVFTPCKNVLATNRAYLIDDCREIVDAFCRRGGRGVLVPRPWNIGWDTCVFLDVPQDLESRIRLGFAHSEESVA